MKECFDCGDDVKITSLNNLFGLDGSKRRARCFRSVTKKFFGRGQMNADEVLLQSGYLHTVCKMSILL